MPLLGVRQRTYTLLLADASPTPPPPPKQAGLPVVPPFPFLEPPTLAMSLSPTSNVDPCDEHREVLESYFSASNLLLFWFPFKKAKGRPPKQTGPLCFCFLLWQFWFWDICDFGSDDYLRGVEVPKAAGVEVSFCGSWRTSWTAPLEAARCRGLGARRREGLKELWRRMGVKDLV